MIFRIISILSCCGCVFCFAVASFDIPFDRQQLADFLCVERAAMSVELSKLQKEGLLVTKRNHFELLTR